MDAIVLQCSVGHDATVVTKLNELTKNANDQSGVRPTLLADSDAANQRLASQNDVFRPTLDGGCCWWWGMIVSRTCVYKHPTTI